MAITYVANEDLMNALFEEYLIRNKVKQEIVAQNSRTTCYRLRGSDLPDLDFHVGLYFTLDTRMELEYKFSHWDFLDKINLINADY